MSESTELILPPADPPADPATDAAPANPVQRNSIASDVETADPDVLLGVSFADPFRAEEFVLALHRLASKDTLALRDVVVVAKDEEGRVRVRETSDVLPREAAMQGAMWSGLLGLLVAGPLGWLAGLGIGAVTGALAAKVVDTGVPDEWVSWFKEAVQPRTATVVALVADVDLGALSEEARRFQGGRLVHATFSPQSTARLAEALRGGTLATGSSAAEDPVDLR